MNTKLHSTVFKEVRRIDEFKNPESLTPEEVTKLENLVLDSKAFAPVKRGGFTVFNSSSAGAGIEQLMDTVSSGTDYLLGLSSNDLIKSNAGIHGWTVIKANITTSLTTRLSIAPYNGRYIITSYDDSPYILQSDLTTIGYLAITAPAVTSVTTQGAGVGGLTPNAKYRYCLVYKTALGEKSPPSQEIIHFEDEETGNSTTGTNSSIWLDTLPVSSDARVVSKLLYRTKADGKIFYLRDVLSAANTFYVDYAADTELDTGEELEYVNPPYIAKYALVHNERIFMAYQTQKIYRPLVPKSAKHGATGYVFHGLAANISGGSLAAGTYSYKVVFVDSIGNTSDALTIEAGVVIASPNNAVKLRCIPTPSSSDVSRQIYRSKDGGAYYLTPIPSNTTQFDDIYDVNSVTIPSASDTLNYYKSLISYSEIGRPAHFKALSFINIFPDDGDEITGMISEVDGIVIFKRNSICKLYPSSSGWRLEKIVKEIGCDEPVSILQAGKRIYFMNNKQVYRLGTLDLPISNRKRITFESITTVHDACYWSARQWYMIVVTINSAKRILVFDEKVDTWYDFSTDNLSWSCLVEKKLGSNRGILLAGHSGLNIVSQYNTADKKDYINLVDAASSINCSLRSKTFTYNEPTSFLRPRVIQSDYKKINPQVGESANVNQIITRVDDGVAVTIVDATNAIGMIESAVISTKGINYAKGDTIVISGGTNGAATVDSVDSNGGIGSITLTVRGYGYTNGTANTTTAQAGSGATVVITTNQTGFKSERKDITGITTMRKYNYEINGRTLDEFNGTVIKSRIVNRGRR